MGIKEEGPTIAAVVGRNVRRVRTELGWSQDEVAVRCRESGLEWTRTTVSLLEGGQRRTLDLGELLVLGLALDVMPGALLQGEGTVQLTDYAFGDLAGVRRIFDERAVVEVALNVVVDRWDLMWDKAASRYPRIFTPKLLHVMKNPNAALIAEAGQEAEQGASRKLKLPDLLVLALSYGLWGKSLTARRDELAGPDANHATKGRITRNLVKELEMALKEGR